MADDMVTSLWRASAHLCTMEEADIREVIEDAADEIERLRAAVERLHSALTPLSICGMVDDMQELCDAFKEARRG